MSQSLHVVFFGDSICFGQGVSPHLGWVTRLAADLDSEALKHGRTVRVTNASLNGNTTRMALERMAYDVQSHGADLIVIQFGMNDCNHWATDRGVARVSLRAFSANLEEMIERARRFGARSVLLNTNHTSGRSTEKLAGTDWTYEQHNSRYNAAIRDLARSAGPDVALVDMEEAFKRHTGGSRAVLESLLQPDLIHLSVAGHQVYYDTMRPPLLAAFKERVCAPPAI